MKVYSLERPWSTLVCVPSAAARSCTGISALGHQEEIVEHHKEHPSSEVPRGQGFCTKHCRTEPDSVSHMGWSLLRCQRFFNSESQSGLISGSDEPSFILPIMAVQCISTYTSSLKMRVTSLRQIPIKKKKLWKCPNKVGQCYFNENGCYFINKKNICFFLGTSL